jgi:hypothetical protein
MMPVALLLLVLSGVTTDANTVARDTCGHLYTDADAVRLTEPAREVVPRGKRRTKKAVLKMLDVDPRRLCNRRVGAMNLGYKICWQLSPAYDLTWWLSAFDGPPRERDSRRVYSVRIMQREPRYWGTGCPPSEEERGVRGKP